MKSNSLRTFFEWALITSVLMSVGFFVWFYLQSRALRAYDSQITAAQARFQNNHVVMGYLLSDCQDYAKTNVEMARLLDSLKARQVAGPGVPAATTKPGGK